MDISPQKSFQLNEVKILKSFIRGFKSIRWRKNNLKLKAKTWIRNLLHKEEFSSFQRRSIIPQILDCMIALPLSAKTYPYRNVGSKTKQKDCQLSHATFFE